MWYILFSWSGLLPRFMIKDPQAENAHAKGDGVDTMLSRTRKLLESVTARGRVMAIIASVAAVCMLCMAPAGLAAQTNSANVSRSSAAPVRQHETTPQLRVRLAKTNRQLKATANATKRFNLSVRKADTLLKLSSRSTNPKPLARQALTIYHRLTRYELISKQRSARLLYQSAHASALAGDIAGGIISLNRLIRSYPNYKLIVEAHFRRAEMYFMHTNYASAVKDYSWVLQHRSTGIYALQSLYKRGWAQYKLSHFYSAMNDQLAAVQKLVSTAEVDSAGRLDLSGLTQSQQVLVKDALYNITLDLASLGSGYSPAQFARDAKAPQLEFVFTNNLVNYYQRKRHYNRAARVAQSFVTRHPASPQAPLLAAHAIKALDSAGSREKALQAKERFVRQYALNQGPVHGNGPRWTAAMRKQLVDYLDSITHRLHARAQRTSAPADYRQAAKWYAHYLSLFPDSPKAQKLAFRRGDLFYEIQDYRQAAQAYDRAAYALPNKGKGGAAGYAAVLSLRKLAGQRAATDPQVKKATLQLVKTYPAYPQTASALARLAEDRYDSGDLDTADQLAGQLLGLQPRPDTALLGKALFIRAEIDMQKQHYSDAQTKWRQLLSMSPAGNKAKIREQLATASYKSGQALVAAGKNAAAVKQFLSIRDTVPVHGEPASEIRAVATYDAATAAIRGGNKSQGASLLKAMRREYPDNKLSRDLGQNLASLYANMGYRTQAVSEYVRVRDNPSLAPDQRRKAALSAAQAYVKLEQPQQAIAAYKNYLNQHNPPVDERMEAEHALVKLYTGLGGSSEADHWRRQLVDSGQNVGTQRGHTLAAKAALALADQARDAFNAVTVHQPVKQTLNKKKQRLQAALDAYGKAADYDITHVTTAATYQIGTLYNRFSQALQNSPRPAGLSADEAQHYEKLLQQQAAPFRKKAISLYMSNVKRIARGVDDKWVRQSVDKLKQMQPQLFKREEQLGDGIVTPG